MSIATAGCSALGLFRPLDEDVEMSLYLLLGLSPMVMKGSDFGQVGGNDGHAGVLLIHIFSRVSGAYPPNMWSKEGMLMTPPEPRCR